MSLLSSPRPVGVAAVTMCDTFCVFMMAHPCFVKSGVELAQSNAAWLLEAGYGRGCVSVNGTTVDCEKR